MVSHRDGEPQAIQVYRGSSRMRHVKHGRFFQRNATCMVWSDILANYIGAVSRSIMQVFSNNHGHANHRSDNYFSVAYWYQTEPHAPFPMLPTVEQRLPRLYPVGGPGNAGK